MVFELSVDNKKRQRASVRAEDIIEWYCLLIASSEYEKGHVHRAVNIAVIKYSCLEKPKCFSRLRGSLTSFTLHRDSSPRHLEAASGQICPHGQACSVKGGKRNEDLILPINSSLSVTLHQDQLKTTTSVATSREFTEDRIWLNGKEDNINHPRLQSCLREIRRLARKRRNDSEDEALSRILAYKVHICSVNNFPTAAGLASSAAGYACLVYTLAKLYGVEGELSEIARQGSGSACRSMYGGFVQWVMGEREDGKDSLAQQVEPETHWPEMRILILVASAEKKHVGSTAGMQTSVETSPLLKMRAESVVPGRMSEMIAAIKQRDFEAFGQLTMKDSNQFHATCLDTYPPIFYLNQVSQRIISLVHRYNAHYGQIKVAYSFDAGPNAVIFTLEPTVREFVEVVKQSFPPETNGGPFLKGLPVSPTSLSEELLSAVGSDSCPGGVQYMIVTQPGPGPSQSQDLTLDLLGSDGFPKDLPDKISTKD